MQLHKAPATLHMQVCACSEKIFLKGGGTVGIVFCQIVVECTFGGEVSQAAFANKIHVNQAKL